MVIIHFLGSILSIAMLKLSIELPSSPLIEACVHCTQLLSKVYIEHHLEALVYFVFRLTLRYRLTTNKHQHWDRQFAAVAILNTYTVHDLNGLNGYTLHCAWAGFSSGEAWEDKVHECFCLRAIQHVMWYLHTLLTCYSRLSREISWTTRMRVLSLNWAVL